MEGKVCVKCNKWKPLEEYNKQKSKKDGRISYCKECAREYKKQWKKNNECHVKEYDQQYREANKERRSEYKKQWQKNNVERIKEYSKQHYKTHKEHYKEQHKQYREATKEHRKEYNKQWREDNKEYIKEYYKDNAEHIREYNKQWREDNKEYIKEYGIQYRESNKQNNLQFISNIVEQINPIFKKLNLPVYGYIYKFENIKTRKVYIGQTIVSLKDRYRNMNIIQGWIKERKKYEKQKFLDELKEEDIKVTEILNVGCCKYHLDKLEAYYIDKYDSCNNGYNNREGNHNTDDGIEEFNKILKENGLKFTDGKLIENNK
jgi:hypothetical protein